MKLNPDRIRTKLQDISKSLARLRRFREMSREDFLSDEDSQDIARSRLLTAIEAALNICYHVTAKKLNQVPEDYAQCFKSLGDARLIDRVLAGKLSKMARFRNRLVHLYWDIDYAQIYDFIQHDIDNLQEFSNQILQIQ